MLRLSAPLLLLLGSCACDPLAKEVIRAMDEVIADHVAWDDWEQWSKIMEEVTHYHIMTHLKVLLFSVFHRGHDL